MRDHHVVSLGYLATLDVLDGCRGAVDAVFDRAVYLVIDHRGPAPRQDATARRSRTRLVVHDTAHGHTPTSLLVDGARPGRWGLQVGDGVAGRLGRVRIGPVLLDARHAATWRPAPSPAHGHGYTSGLAALASLPPYEHTVDALDRLRLPCRALVRALDSGRARDLAASLRALVGAGPGSTPSGDDALVGFLAVLTRAADAGPGSPRTALDHLRVGLPPLLDRTTPISAHYLRLALDGHVGEHLVALVDAALRGAIDAAAPARVRATGATSGSDSLVGVDAALGMLAARRVQAVA